MSETQQLHRLVAGCLVLGIVGLVIATVIPPLFEGDLVVDQYEAGFSASGILTEKYTYEVKNSGEYRMLYRIWEAPLVLDSAPEPFIQFVSMEVPEEVTGYVRDNEGVVTTPLGQGDTGVTSAIGSLAEVNEIGIYRAARFSAGTYPVTYTYVVHPPLEYDAVNTHLNLKLAGSSHIQYRNVRVTVPSENIDVLYAYPASLSVREEGGTYIITGPLAENEIFAVEMVSNSDAFPDLPAFRSTVEGVKGKTESAAFWYNLPYYGALALNLLAKAAVFLIPLLLFWIYTRYGREKDFGVPEYLSTTPDTRLKPWQVNLLFKGDALDFDEAGYYATLLDLHRRKLIAITEKAGGKGIEIRILNTSSTDPYEQRVLAFIASVSQDGILDTTRIETLAKEAQTKSSAEETMLKYQRMLKDVTGRVDAARSVQYMVDGRDHVVPILLSSIALLGISLILFLVMPLLGALLFPAVLLGAVALVQSIIAIAMPSTLFGHWKDDRYKEKLEWDSFAHFLSDLAMMERYSPADISMWGEWLVYGTALGVGDKVEQAMKSLNISIPETGVPVGVMGINYAFVPLMHFTPPSHGSSGGGGGGFGGGGFGGGGAGGR